MAQQRQTPGATISGHVSLADTGRPARFATVYLKAMTPPEAGNDLFTALMDSSIANMQNKRLNGTSPSAEDDSDLKSARKAAKRFLHHVTEAMLSATVDANGGYSFKDVPAGVYYLHVQAPGYIDTLNEFSEDELATQDLELQRKIAATVSSVTVRATEQVREDVRLERGASVSGRILFDDGSPATGWTVRALVQRNAGSNSSEPSEDILGIDLAPFLADERFQTSVTDDQGHFRLAGLPSGRFVLEARFVTAALDRQPFRPVASSEGSFLSILGGLSDMRGLKLAVYSGSAVRLHDAETLTLRAGEERAGTDMVAHLGSARSITGNVVSKTDGHSINSGNVDLIAQDKDGKDDLSTKMSATVQPDGSFRFDYIPAPGMYTLRSVHVSDTSLGSTMKLLGSLVAQRKNLQAYASTSTVVRLQDEDLAGIRLSVSDLSAASAVQ